MAKTIMIKPACSGVVYIDGNEARRGTQREYWLAFSSGAEKPTAGVNHGDLLYYEDWYDLTEEQKKACRARVWAYNIDAGKWHPQTKPYGG